MTAEAAAAMLGTSTRILSLWGERFGFPLPDGSLDGQPLYPDEMMIALRDALDRELSIASAITEARRVRRIRRYSPDPAPAPGSVSDGGGIDEEAP